MRQITLTLDGPVAVGKSRLLRSISYALNKVYPGAFTFIGDVVDCDPLGVNTVEPVTITVVETTAGRHHTDRPVVQVTTLPTAEEARALAAGTTHEELLALITKKITEAAKRGWTRTEVEEGSGVRGVSDWNGSDDATVIGKTAAALRKAGYVVRKTVTGQRHDVNALSIEWKSKVTPTGGLGYWDR
uniref:Uncharacterized protein n=1 Tax=Caulobacter phage BL57 TaxID=3348355 RepID=A0AB74UGJ9_9VIRU